MALQRKFNRDEETMKVIKSSKLISEQSHHNQSDLIYLVETLFSHTTLSGMGYSFEVKLAEFFGKKHGKRMIKSVGYTTRFRAGFMGDYNPRRRLLDTAERTFVFVRVVVRHKRFQTTG